MGNADDPTACRLGVEHEQDKKTNRKKRDGDGVPLRLTGLRCVLSALDPPRSNAQRAPNRVVQRRSAEGTGGMTPWETRSMHLEQFNSVGGRRG